MYKNPRGHLQGARICKGGSCSDPWPGETYPARASVARSPGGIALDPEQDELGADSTALG